MLWLLKKKQSQLDEAKRKAEIAELERMAAIPFPVARVPPQLIEPIKQRSYEEVAQSIGFAPVGLLLAQLLEFFTIEGIKLYNYNQVNAWMIKKRKQDKSKIWCWRAFREKDIIRGHFWGCEEKQKKCSDGFYYYGDYDDEAKNLCRPYDQLVPLHVLEKVVKIEAKFGNRVKFFVSDYVAPNPDPFIMVRPTIFIPGPVDAYSFVFDVWNEPGFGV